MNSTEDPLRQAANAALAANREDPAAARAHAAALELAAPAAESDDLDAALAEADRSCEITVDAPALSPRPVVRTAKRLVRRATAWQLRHVADQVTVLAAALTRAVSGLADRVDGLDRRVDELERRVRELEHRARSQP